jgi:hypothetical protein
LHYISAWQSKYNDKKDQVVNWKIARKNAHACLRGNAKLGGSFMIESETSLLNYRGALAVRRPIPRAFGSRPMRILGATFIHATVACSVMSLSWWSPSLMRRTFPRRFHVTAAAIFSLLAHMRVTHKRLWLLFIICTQATIKYTQINVATLVKKYHLSNIGSN